MKRLIIINLVLISLLNSCTTSENNAIEIVTNFYNEVYENGADKYCGSLKKSREVLNYSYVTEEMKNLIKNNFLYIPEKGTYEVTAEKKSEDTVIVTSIGKGNGIFGNIIEVRNQFVIAKVSGNWKISDSYNLIGYYLNFSVEDTQWQSYWDIKKSNILTEVINSLNLEIITTGEKAYKTSMRGDLRLVNKSKYDIKNIEILIEHFDKDGVSVNTDNVYVNSVIRSDGYREFDWYTTDCASCITQTFKIKFVLETIK